MTQFNAPNPFPMKSGSSGMAPIKPPAMPTIPAGVRSFTDTEQVRDGIFSGILDSVKKKYPIENERYKLEIANPRYDSPKHFSLQEQKSAILSRDTLDWKLRGNWRLTDKATGKVVSEADKVIARVPYMTQRGTFIYGGNEYTVANQQRLRPGVYARLKENGELESHVNLMPGTGSSFRIQMDPKTGVFKLNVGQASMPLYPLLKALGAKDSDIHEAWGKLAEPNMAKDDPGTLKKIYAKFADSKTLRTVPDPIVGLRTVFDRMGLDPEVSIHNLGKPHAKVTHEAIMAATNKLLKINRGEAESDDRDSQANQTLHTVDDLFKERISKDAGQLGRRILWKSTLKGHVDHIPSSVLTPQLHGVLLHSGLAMPLEETNPMDVMDQLVRVTRLGEGGIGGGSDSVPDEARNVQPSQLGLIDPIRGPESQKIGVDARLAIGTYRGPDGQLMREVFNPRTNRTEVVPSRTLVHSALAFPGELDSGNAKVRAMVDGKIRYVNRKEVDYALPHAEHMFSPHSNLIPLSSGIKGGRLLMAGKMINQALPLRYREAPLVQSAAPDGMGAPSFEGLYGTFAGAIRAKQGGSVLSVDKDSIKVKQADGKVNTYELYNNFPLNRKTFWNSHPVVKPGDKFQPGQLLAHSNYTDSNGTLALGTNLRTAFMNYRGMNYEDAVVLSESAAKRLQSEHMHTMDYDHQPDHKVGRNSYVSIYPGKFNRDQLSRIGDDGVIKVGSVIKTGDPLILAISQKQPTAGQALHRVTKAYHQDAAHVWDHKAEGVITDVNHDKDGIKIAIKSYAPMKVGDKMSNRYGGKGVVSTIVPDEHMPKNRDGSPFEVLLNPQGVISRVNPSQLVEAALGKIARKTGKPYMIRGFPGMNITQFALDELKKNGLSETEEVWDPHTNRWLPKIFTGEKFFFKLHHTAESKESGRDIGGYTADEQPARGGAFGAKRLGGLDINALISHGATEVLRDAKLVRGQRNDQYWQLFRMGYPAPMPNTPFIYNKFMSYLKGAGVNLERDGDKFHILGLTDKDTTKLSRGELTSGDAVSMKDSSPVPGGLFDVGITGGHGGPHWSHIALAEALPSPVMEEPVRRLLGMTKKAFEEQLKKPDGAKEISDKLGRINIDDEIQRQRETIKAGKASKRDDAIKVLGYLNTFKKNGMHPLDMMWSKVPVIPPSMRPISKIPNAQIISDANLLYKDLFEANQNLKTLKGQISDVGQERLTTYNALKAVVGLGDPLSVKLQDKGVGGLLLHTFGKGSPKFSMFQRRVMATTLDSVGRAAITPNPSLDMDHVGLPESMAWKVYQPFIMRRLARRFNTTSHEVPLTELAKWVANRDPRAKQALLEELDARPVIINRAPVLHRYGMMAAFPKLTPGETLQISPIVTGGFGADFDGDAMNYHVPVSEGAVTEAIAKMLPSHNLRTPSTFKVHYLPQQEYLHGLYLATHKKSDKPTRTFASEKDVVDAYMRGEISANDSVVVHGK